MRRTPPNSGPLAILSQRDRGRAPSSVAWRGVAGLGARRRVRGFSWTADQDKAKWFADRSGRFGLANPAVASTTIRREQDVLAYANRRQEQEYIILSASGGTPREFRPEGEDMTIDNPFTDSGGSPPTS